MDYVRAFGTFYKSNGHIFRKAAYLQFGSSSRSLGATIMLNPGYANFKDESITMKDSDTTGEITPDRTMIRLAEILRHVSQASLEGRFHIYNLFSLQNTSSKDAVKQEEWLREAYTNNVEIINQFLLEQHPWVLLAWSTEKGVELNRLKEQWFSAIKAANIKMFGIQAKGKAMFYHPYPRILSHRERYLQQIIHQFQNDEHIIV
ncbi:hypothetical protein A9488_08865 [Bacillus cereus]|uniref:DUF1643 domain-containing protein n=1 Tax=Bacillus cereus TaxID=1396 RepID=UPI0008FE4CD4|nr:DUF1643 domain-containing protein [Bacillus cereus]MCM3201613.1 DUF1643 domain-containing protein [Bacillus cereus]MDN4100456.1 DUF1643 domain-containing protein [Bacillus cereus]OJE14567.1 hypothetical protein A9488_08865 [Bacillus cereus]